MKGKVCMVTGANAGIGFETAMALAKLEATVVLVCRDATKGTKALNTIKKESNNNSIHLYIADLSSQKSIRQMTTQFLEKFDRLDVLINNAGIIVPTRQSTVDNLEMQFAVNHMAPFLLCQQLLNALQASPAARIITVTSNAHTSAALNFNDLQSEHSYNPKTVYQQTKLCNVLFTYELAKRLENSNIAVNCLHPGVVKTKLLNEYNGGKGGFLNQLFYSKPAKGAATSVYLASSSEVEGISGQYFANKKPIPSSKYSKDASVASQLWEISKGLAKETI